MKQEYRDLSFSGFPPVAGSKPLGGKEYDKITA
jgi:hypothetical protein